MPPRKSTSKSPAKAVSSLGARLSALPKAERTAVLNAIVRQRSPRFNSTMAGKQYGGERDIYGVAGYVPADAVLFSHYWGMYTRGDVAGRIVDMPANTTWRTPPEITEPLAEDSKKDEEGNTEFVRAFNALAKRLRLWEYLTRVDRLAGVGRYAVLFLGTRGSTDQTLRQPLDRLTKPEDLLYFSIYHEGNAKIDEWETDVSNPRYGMPRIYKLTTSRENTGSTVGNQSLQVHATRVLHIAENLSEDEVYGRPRLERPLNRLFDLDKVAASTGEAYWQAVARILQANIDPGAEIDDAALAELDEKLGAIVHDLRRQFFGQGVKLEWLGGDTPNVSQVGDFFFSLIAGASGIPKRILFGSELGELASSQDQSNWYGTINERQENHAEPKILRPLIDKFIGMGVLPAPASGQYTVVWPTLFEESDKDKAEASLKRAQAAAALTPVGGDPSRLVVIDDDSIVWLKPMDGSENEDADEDDLDDDEEDEDELEDENGVGRGVKPTDAGTGA